MRDWPETAGKLKRIFLATVVFSIFAYITLRFILPALSGSDVWSSTLSGMCIKAAPYVAGGFFATGFIALLEKFFKDLMR